MLLMKRGMDDLRATPMRVARSSWSSSRELGVIAIAPTYFNNVHGRMMDAITRTWMPCWRNDSYQYGPVKRAGVMLTCTGAPADYLKTVTRAFFTMADPSIISPEYRTEVFNGCGTPDTVASTPEFLETARSLVRWAIRAEDGAEA